MEPAFPAVDVEDPIERLSTLLSRETPAVLVAHDGTFVGVVTRYDVLHKIAGIR